MGTYVDPTLTSECAWKDERGKTLLSKESPRGILYCFEEHITAPKYFAMHFEMIAFSNMQSGPEELPQANGSSYSRVCSLPDPKNCPSFSDEDCFCLLALHRLPILLPASWKTQWPVPQYQRTSIQKDNGTCWFKTHALYHFMSSVSGISREAETERFWSGEGQSNRESAEPACNWGSRTSTEPYCQ